MAARREAEADVLAQVAAGHSGSEGTTSSIPSLVPGEGRVSLPAAPAPPATAPPEDKFNNDDAGHLLARCRDRSARQQWFDAIGDCRRSYELNPSSIEPQVELMRLLVTLQSYADAEEAARKVLAAKPDDPHALYYLAWSYRGRDQFPKAIAVLQRTIALSPARVEYVQALGMTYCLAENYGKGIATLEQALAMRPGDARIQGMITEARAHLSEKLAPYQKLVREKPTYDNHAALGFIYQKYGLSQRALTSYDSALAKIPTPLPEQDKETKTIGAQIYYNRGVVYRELGRPDLGEAALWQAMQLDPSLSPVAWYYVGLCRYDAGKYDKSIEALRQSVELAPDVADNRAALADSYEKAGKQDLAREQRNAVLALEARAAAAKEAIAREEARGGKTPEEAAASAAMPVTV
ncbi:MAG: tetratricopeptide repeat protein, partial [Candidatus Binatia bacterium]